MIKANYHTHSTFCDGKDSIEELCLSAIEQGFSHLGYSGHSYLENADSYALNDKKVVDYYNEIHRVMDKYADKINIYCGIEQDCFSKPTFLDFEYKIGSVHNIKRNGEYLPDHSQCGMCWYVLSDADQYRYHPRRRQCRICSKSGYYQYLGNRTSVVLYYGICGKSLSGSCSMLPECRSAV